MRVICWIGVALCVSIAQAAVIYESDFEGGQAPGWLVPDGREDRTAVAVVGPDDDAPEMAAGERCLRMRGTAMWNICELALEEPVALTGPIYLMADWQSRGPVGQMGLLLIVEGVKQPVFSTTGPVGRLATDRWDTLVARLDQFDPAVAGKNLTAVRLAVRCTVGAETGDGAAAERDTYLDNVRILSGDDVQQAVEAAARQATPREYTGPERFAIQDEEELAVWYTPSLAPALRNTPVPETAARPIRVRLARREAESFETVVTIRRDAEVTVKVLPSLLAGPEGGQIPAEMVSVHPVRTVPILTRVGFPAPMDWPDPLSHDEGSTVTGPCHVPIWVTVQAPENARPGIYTGRLTVMITGEMTVAVNVPLEVEVLDFDLPLRPSFRTNQQLWGVKRGETRPWLEELAARKMYDASWWYSDADERQWRMDELGQNAIKINMVGGHGHTPVKLDGHEIYSDEYAEVFRTRLAQQLASVRDNGWEQDAFIYIWDENWGLAEVFDHVKYLAGLIREQTTEVPILAALPVDEKIEGVVNIYLAEYSPDEIIRSRMAAGDEFWRWGNVDLQIGKAPLAVRLCYGLESVKRGFIGAYSWGVSAWRESDPWVAHDRSNWGGSLFYPGMHEGSAPDRPVPSIRMELLRDGIEDFEYVTILRGLIEARGQAAPEAAARARALIEEAEGLANVPADFRRCDEGVDEIISVRARMQDAILELQAIN